MTRDASQNEPRLRELLAGRALGDLSAAEERELEPLLRSEEHQQFGEELEYTVATIDQMLAKSSRGSRAEGAEQLPDETRRKIVQQAQASLAALAAGARTVTPDKPPNQPESLDEVRPAEPLRSGWRWREALAWLACAASLLLAIGLWQRQTRPTVRDAIAARAELLREDPLALQATFAPGKTPFDREARGDVVWSTRLQKGYLRLRDMPVNDPSREQYQLWIIDPERDDEPIDGGVFDIPSSNEAIIPIDAKLQVQNPQAFAITIEKPGGVVVSTQERLPLLALVAN